MGDAAGAIPALRRALAPGAEGKALARLAEGPRLAREMEAFAKAAAKATDVKAALRDPKVYILSVMGCAQLLGLSFVNFFPT